MRASTVLLVLHFAAACAPRPDLQEAEYWRITTRKGRLYYTKPVTTLQTSKFLAFRDLVTGEDVRLERGGYIVEPCSRKEVGQRQEEWLENPTKVPYRAWPE